MEVLGCFAVAFVVIMAFIGLVFFLIARHKRRELEKAYASYQQALAALRANPANPEARASALAWGRQYSSLARDSKGVTTYDEVALSNDIGAATAGAGQAPRGSVAERLRRLDELRSQQAVSEDEYRSQRARIIEEV
jgi:hypothetical protein